MRANIEDSYAELAPAAARLLRLLSLYPGDEIGPGAAAAGPGRVDHDDPGADRRGRRRDAAGRDPAGERGRHEQQR